jgi:hypothetical protein
MIEFNTLQFILYSLVCIFYGYLLAVYLKKKRTKPKHL